MKEDEDYTIDVQTKTISFTEQGIDKAEHAFRTTNLYDVNNQELVHHLDQSLRANYIMLRDIDYVVNDDEVKIVSDLRMNWKDAVTQMVCIANSQRNVEIQKETKQWRRLPSKLFRMYEKLAGMTGTAKQKKKNLQKFII